MLDLIENFLSFVYPWVKALHIISVISWMAGIFYLPRLFVHHREQGGDVKEISPIFEMMEVKLLRVIMTPAMIATWGFGLALVLTPGIVDWSMVWPWSKALSVVLMTAFHFWLGKQRKALQSGEGMMSGRQYRLMNEVPTVLMVLIVISVVVKF